MGQYYKIVNLDRRERQGQACGQGAQVIPFFPGRPSRIWPAGDFFQHLVTNPAWAVEPKLDGYRVVCVWNARGVEAWTRHGNPQKLSVDVRAALEALDLAPGSALDGELLGPRKAGSPQSFVAFDYPCVGGKLDARPLDMRRATLERLRLPVIERLSNKVASYERALAAGHEGVVLKRRDSRYPFGHGPTSETTVWLKAKAATVDGRLVAVR
jgi:ATP-dependent DNA ligase